MQNIIKISRGFTLIEIIIAITIIALLSVTGVTAYTNEVVKSKANADLLNARQIGIAINKAYVDGQIKPTDGYFTSSSTDLKDMNAASGLGSALLNINYLQDQSVFKVKGRERDNWKFAYSLTTAGIVNVYVCEPSSTEKVMLYPTVDPNTTIEPYAKIKN